jgi:hypothetical protein
METKIPFRIIELEDVSYHLLVPVVINKNLHVNLIIDTGASKTILDFAYLQKVANDIEVVQSDLSSGINSFIEDCYSATLDSFAIGNLIIEPYPCVLMDMTHVNQLYTKIGQGQVCGLLGSDFLKKYNATISFTQQRLTLRY